MLPYGHSYIHNRKMIKDGAIGPEKMVLNENFTLQQLALTEKLIMQSNKLLEMGLDSIKYDSVLGRILFSGDIQATDTVYAEVFEGTDPNTNIEAPANGNIVNTLGDDGGVNKLLVRDSGYVEVASIDSYGELALDGDIILNSRTIEGLIAAVSSGQAVRYDEFIALQGGIIRKAKVIAYVDCTAAPPTEVTGDRYLLNDVGAVNVAWDGASGYDIVQFDGVVWVATTPEDGWQLHVDTGIMANLDATFVDVLWEFSPVTFPDHNDTLNLQGGTALERYHLTLAQYNDVPLNTTHRLTITGNPHQIGINDLVDAPKTGTVAGTLFTGTPTRTYTVVFNTVMPSANYIVMIMSTSNKAWTVATKTVNSFIINSNSANDLTGETVDWIATLHNNP